MPSPTAGLFGGLAQGIFGRMREHEDEQRKLDLEDKKNALNSLSSLLENATPETRPVIYKQMADVMSLKGKHRGVWDMLTGGGRQDYHDQLASKLDGVFGNVVGPEAYEQLKSHPEAGYSGLPAAGGPAWASPTITQTPDQTAGKIALEDPTLNKVKLLQATYGLRSANDSNKLWEGAEAKNYTNEIKGDLGKERDAAKITLTATMKAQGDILKRGMQMAQAQGRAKPTDDDLQAAALQLGTETGNHDEALQALTALRKAQTQYYANGGSQGGGADKPITPYQQTQIDKDLQAKGVAVFQNWNKAKATINKLDTEHQAVRKQLNQIASANGLAFDEANGQFLDSKTGKAVDLDTLPVSSKQLRGMLDKMAKLAADKAAAYQEMQGHRATLEGQFGPLYKFNGEWDVQPSEMGGVAPAGAPRTTDATTKPGVNIADIQEVIGSATRPASAYKVNQLVSIGGQKYKVSSVTPPTEDRPYGSYVLKAVK